MTGARNIKTYPQTEDPWVSMNIGTNNSGFNHLAIYLRSNNTYSMLFSKIKKDPTTQEERIIDRSIQDNIPFWKLRESFEEITGLTTHLIELANADNLLSPQNKHHRGISH